MGRILLILVLLSHVELAHGQTIEDQLRDLRTEVQRLRQELDDVKQQLRDRDEGLDETLAGLPYLARVSNSREFASVTPHCFPFPAGG